MFGGMEIGSNNHKFGEARSKLDRYLVVNTSESRKQLWNFTEKIAIILSMVVCQWGRSLGFSTLAEICGVNQLKLLNVR